MALTPEQIAVLQQMRGLPGATVLAPMPGPMSPVASVPPFQGWQNNLAAMVAQQARNPIAAPFPAGTITQRRREDEALQRHRGEQMAIDRERLALSRQVGGGEQPTVTRPTAAQQRDAMMQAIRRGAVSATRELINVGLQENTPFGEGVKFRRMSPQEAVDYVGGLLLEEGLSIKDFDETMEIVYRAAGLPSPKDATKPAFDLTGLSQNNAAHGQRGASTPSPALGQLNYPRTGGIDAFMRSFGLPLRGR